jgi:hypothetical protein
MKTGIPLRIAVGRNMISCGSGAGKPIALEGHKELVVPRPGQKSICIGDYKAQRKCQVADAGRLI